MRITNKMLSNNSLRDMNVNLQNMSKIQQQITSGKEIRRPSDDPIKVARAMQLKTDINTNNQYNENIQSTLDTLDFTDTELGHAGDVMQNLNELLVSAGNPGSGTDGKSAIKDKISQAISELSQIMNTNIAGKYLFGGTRGTTKPMDTVVDATTKNTSLIYYKAGGGVIDTTAVAGTSDATEYKQIGSKLNVEISQGVTVDYNVCASEVLQFPQSDSTGTSDLRTLFTKILNHLDGKNDTGGVPVAGIDSDPALKLINEDLQGVKDAMSNILALRSKVGTKTNMLESAKTNNEDQTAKLTEVLSKTQDIDLAQKMMEYSSAQSVYMASLQTSAKIIQPTLLDYLK